MRWISDQALTRLQEAVALPDLSGTEYRILDKIGSGGMGVVYLAEDGKLNRKVALKVMSIPDPTGEMASRMLREAHIVARLDHPGIVPIHDVGALPDGRVFYTMKLVKGAPLDKYLPRIQADRQSIADALRLYQRICEAVAFAHAHGVIHRDLKPENVMVGPFGEVLVMDWGVAKVIDEAETDQPAAPDKVTSTLVEGASPLLTAPGTILGTPAYMAPEQALGGADSIDQRTDVYALGALLYFLLTRRPPGIGADPLRPRLLNRGVPRAVEAICLKAMAPRPGDRYQDVEELAADVARYLDASKVTAHRENVFELAIRWIAKNRFVTLLVVAYLLMRVVIFFLTGR